MIRKRKPLQLSEQMKRRLSSSSTKKAEYDGSVGTVINTGSTLLDLSISGGRIRGGGIPAGILVEIFGPSGSGKTVLLSEIAGAVQRQKGEIMFHDPEARLNKQFARMFGLDTNKMNYSRPDTIPELFSAVRKWSPISLRQKTKRIHGIFADSLAALSTDMEMEKDEGDKMGMRRPKEFSEELRKTCRILAQNNYLMVCSNQIRQNVGGGDFAPKFKSPGGEALGFYSSLRLKTSSPQKIKIMKRVAGKEVKRVVGVNIEVEIFKSSVWKPHHTAPLTILFDYGIDSIKDELQFIKTYKNLSTYRVEGVNLDKSLYNAISIVEGDNLENKLKEEVINLWEEIESKFLMNRSPKKR